MLHEEISLRHTRRAFEESSNSTPRAQFPFLPFFASWIPHIALYPLLLMGFLLCRVVRKDYQAYLSLGPGGTPSNFKGFLRISFLGIFRLRAVLEAPKMTPTIYPKQGFLDPNIRPRAGNRPIVRGVAPQRQVTQRASPDLYKSSRLILSSLASQYPRDLFTGPSAIEGGHALALFSRAASPSLRPKRDAEICHLHALDGSMHVILHPADIATVLNLGYGERHPLARSDWWWRPVVPETFVLAYGCRNMDEVEVLRKVVCAGAWNVCGKEFL